MKGKLDLRFNMPNTGRFRSRVENPSKELTSQMRTKLAEIAADTLNKNILEIRAQFIAYVDSLGLKYKSAAHEAQVKNVTNNLFDVVFAETQAKLDAICGDENDDDDEPTKEASAEEAQASAEEAQEAAQDAADDFE